LVLTPEGLTEPVTLALVALAELTLVVVALGAPALKLNVAPVALPEPLVALSAAQYWVPAVSPVRLTETLWKLESVNASTAEAVVLAGEPLVPWLVHQVEVARS
jgi:hypothetical protein